VNALNKNWRVADATPYADWRDLDRCLLVTELKAVSQALRPGKESPRETIRAVMVAVSA